MIKKYAQVFLGVLAASLLAVSASANVLVNPGFEDTPFPGAETFVGDAGTGWTGFGGIIRIQFSPPIGPAGAHGGTVVLKTFGVAGVFQDFATTAGEAWDGSAWAMNDSFDLMTGGQIAAVNIEWLDAGGANIGTEFGDTIDASAPVDTWVLLSASGVAPTGAEFARLVLITGDFAPGGPGGAPRFDDAYFGPRPIPVPAAVWLFGSALGLLGLGKRRKA